MNGPKKLRICKPKDKHNIRTDPKEVLVKTVAPNTLYSCPLVLPEILHNVFSNLEIKELKLCRLASKLWNQEASLQLQKISYAHLKQENKNQITQFLKIVDKIRENQAPSPFKYLQVSSTNLDDEFIELLLSSSTIPVAHFRLQPKKNCRNLKFAENLYKTLTSNFETLKYFDCTLTSQVRIEWGKIWKERSPLFLPALRGLNFDDTDVPTYQSDWTSFLVEITNGAPYLSTLNMITFDDQVFNSIMIHSKLTNLEEIFIQDFTPRHFPLFSTYKLAKLRSLNLDVVQISEENMLSSEDLLLIVKNFSETIEELSVNWAANTPVAEGSFPHCPRLKQLTIDNWPGSLGIFDSSKLPALDTITVYEEIECNVDISRITNPHVGVENLKWEGNPRFESTHPTMDEKKVYTIVYLSYQFPNLRYLDLTCAASDDMIRTVVTHFPQLEVFELTTECILSESIFTGINKYTLQNFLDHGISLETCIRVSSLTDMMSLKKLALHSYDQKGFAISNNAVVYGIAEMPSLQILHIDWTTDLDMDVIFRNLSHLSHLVIKNYQKLLPRETLQAMQSRMPQIKFDPDPDSLLGLAE